MKMIKLSLIALMSFGLTTAVSAQYQNNDFDIWDEDEDGLIDNDEFESGLEDQNLFETYDTDADGIIDDTEWTSAVEENDYLEDDYYDTWDINNDGYVYEDEFYDGAYSTWDVNDDDYVDNEEYDENYSEWSK